MFVKYKGHYHEFAGGATSDPSHLVCDEFATPETEVPIRGRERGQVERVKTLG